MDLDSILVVAFNRLNTQILLNGLQKNLKMAPMVTERYLNIAFFFVRLSASDLCMVKQCPMQ